MKSKYPIIELLINSLQASGFETVQQKSGFKINLNKNGLPGDTASFYTPKNSPGFARVRVTTKDFHTPLTKDELQIIQDKLQKGAHKNIEINEFQPFGDKKKFYFAHIGTLEEAGQEFSYLNSAIEALALIKGIDSKNIRKGLDGMGLSRSSIIRFSLIRIFRDSVNTEELLNTLFEEAKRISRTKEANTLNCLKQKSDLPFITCIINLLLVELTKYQIAA